MLHGTQARDISLRIEGPFASQLTAGDDNLVLRAARMLAKEDQGARLVLTKNLPLASGLGGGSADAAAALRLLGRLWAVEEDFAGIALRLGADVPVCLGSCAARMRGIGERLDPAPDLPACGITLVNPGVPVSTADIFRARHGAFSAEPDLPAEWRDAPGMAADLGRLRNDLEAPAIGLCPVIQTVLGAIAAEPGCLLARMSGSGATCFGLFASHGAAEEAAKRLAHPGWWIWGGGLFDARFRQ